VSFYNPQLEGWSTHYIPLEAAVKDCCRLLLYVISEDTRAMTSMIEVQRFSLDLFMRQSAQKHKQHLFD